VGTALIYLLVVVVVAAAFFGIAALVFGRGEELPPLPPDATPTRLPSRAIGAHHVRALRFPLALRGYRMTEVDWVLDRLAAELERAETERGELAARIAELEAARPAAPPRDRPPSPAPAPAPGTPAREIAAPETPTPAREAPARGDAGSTRIGE
jgi:DivIVA domain-containing protein